MLCTGGQNHKRPTNGHSGHLTPAVSGVAIALDGGEIGNGPQAATLATKPLPSRGSSRLSTEDKIRNGPHVGKNGYLTHAVSGVPNALYWGIKSEMAYMWAQWLPNPCRLGGPQCFGRGTKSEMAHMRAQWLPNPCRLGGPQCSGQGTDSEMVHMWAQWLPNPCHLGGPQCSARGKNHKWPTCGHTHYLTPAVSGVPNALHRGTKSQKAHQWAQWLPNPCRLGGPQCFGRGTKSEMAHMRAQWLPNPCRLGGPQCSGQGTDSEMVHMWAQWLPNPCHLGGPQCSARGQNHKWPTCGHTRYLTPAVSGVPNALHRGTKSQKAHQWAQWPPNPCRLRGRHCFGWGRNRKWPTSGHTGYQTSAVSGVLKAFNGGQNQKWPTCGQKWLPNTCRLGGPQCSVLGDKIRNGLHVGTVATEPLPSRGSPMLWTGDKIANGPHEGTVVT